LDEGVSFGGLTDSRGDSPGGVCLSEVERIVKESIFWSGFVVPWVWSLFMGTKPELLDSIVEDFNMIFSCVLILGLALSMWIVKNSENFSVVFVPLLTFDKPQCHSVNSNEFFTVKISKAGQSQVWKFSSEYFSTMIELFIDGATRIYDQGKSLHWPSGEKIDTSAHLSLAQREPYFFQPIGNYD
jgi:hypothetical protein